MYKMVFNAQKDEKGYHVDVNQQGMINYNAWVTGIEATAVAATMNIDLTAGNILFQGASKGVALDTITLDAADATYDRQDLVVHNGTAFEVIKGDALIGVTAKPQNYNIQN